MQGEAVLQAGIGIDTSCKRKRINRWLELALIEMDPRRRNPAPGRVEWLRCGGRGEEEEIEGIRIK